MKKKVKKNNNNNLNINPKKIVHGNKMIIKKVNLKIMVIKAKKHRKKLCQNNRKYIFKKILSHIIIIKGINNKIKK